MATHRSIGLIAGGGELPLYFARQAKALGYSVHTVAVLGSASKAIEKSSDSIEWVSIGQVGKLISRFKKQKVNQAVMHGKVEHAALFNNLKLDLKALSLWIRLKDRSGEGLLKALAEELKKQGVLLKDCRFLMDDLLTPKGLLIGRVGGEKPSVDYGIKQAKLIAGAGIGQTLVVKRSAVVAVEAMEGTDKTIQRAGELAGPGIIVVKVTSPSQDWRFDVPTVGPETVQKLISAKAKGLVLEAGKSFLIQKEKIVSLSKKHGFFIQSI
jgi:DUF1009 family protein